MNTPIVVLKVGGSLLDWPDLPDRLSAYLRGRPEIRPVLVVGGGRFADALRDLDRRHAIGEARAHALALRVLDLTAHVLADLVPGLAAVDAIADLDRAWSRTLAPVLAPRKFLDRDDRSPGPLPHAWSTTTDAIAARLAVRLQARELVLLKSADCPPGATIAEAASLGLVDAEFARAASTIPTVAYSNLRREPTKVASLSGDHSSSASALSSGSAARSVF